MTEAAHQMASNPLAPGAQWPGAEGLPAGPIVRIAREIENRLIDGVGEKISPLEVDGVCWIIRKLHRL